MYFWFLGRIFWRSKETFLRCDQVCEKLSTEEREYLIKQYDFDHRTLQETHDLIAIAFRYNKRNGQLTLFEPTPAKITRSFDNRFVEWNRGKLSDYELIWAYNWEIYYLEHVYRLTSIESHFPKFVKHVINATVFNPNTESGMESEHELRNIVIKYFDLFDVLKR
jgi:hypothetical protein